MPSLTFLGAAGTVTGSRYLLRSQGRSVLVDAGLFQGLKELRQRNREEPRFDPKTLDAVILTHAHIDHTGWLPLLVRRGFKGPVYCTPGTRDLAALLLPDSGRLQEEEARYANKTGWSKHAPNAEALYGEADAVATLPLLNPIPYGTRRDFLPGLSLTFHKAGHILGSAHLELRISEPGKDAQAIVFSGDLGRYGAPILPDPEPPPAARHLLVECTYGDRLHSTTAPGEQLREAVVSTAARGGCVLIPSFAIGRTQEILFTLRALEADGKLPAFPVFVDSPMAVDATPMYLAHAEDHDDEMRALIAQGVEPLRPSKLRFARSPDQSKAINDVKEPCIIISASGMATGGRILHHLKRRLPDPRNTVLLVGYQSVGTRGHSLQNGAKTLRIHGEEVPVAAEVATISGFSAHGDYHDVDRWLAGEPSKPGTIFCVHGEPPALAATQKRLADAGFNAVVPQYLQEVEL